MADIIHDILVCIERGKVDAASPYPPDLKGQDGADEYAERAIESGAGPDAILKACEEGMARIGEKFGAGKAFVPELLMSAKAMKAVMARLRPFFASGSVKAKGVLVIGTVSGDLHDIGKNLVAMAIEGAGWEVVDLGVDVKAAKFIEAVKAKPACVVGLSALLTTTMAAMESAIKEIKAASPGTMVIVGGAPVTRETAEKMGADGYGKDPRGAVMAIQGLGAA